MRTLQNASPSSRLVIMTDRATVSARLLQGLRACGFISKSWGIEEIVAAVRLAGLGLGLAPPELAGDVPHLTVREEQVLAMIARGETNDQIATDLSLSPNTVKQHASSAYRKLRRPQPDRSGPAGAIPRADRVTSRAISPIRVYPVHRL